GRDRAERVEPLQHGVGLVLVHQVLQEHPHAVQPDVLGEAELPVDGDLVELLPELGVVHRRGGHVVGAADVGVGGVGGHLASRAGGWWLGGPWTPLEGGPGERYASRGTARRSVVTITSSSFSAIARRRSRCSVRPHRLSSSSGSAVRSYDSPSGERPGAPWCTTNFQSSWRSIVVCTGG